MRHGFPPLKKVSGPALARKMKRMMELPCITVTMNMMTGYAGSAIKLIKNYGLHVDVTVPTDIVDVITAPP